MKVCVKPYCKKEFRSEEYAMSGGKCPKCGEQSLELKYKDAEIHSWNTIPDKERIDDMIRMMNEKLEKLDNDLLT